MRMVTIISHRGNISGPSANTENVPEHINNVIKHVLVVIDVWNVKNEWHLGTEEPTHMVDVEFLKHENLILRARNMGALSQLTETDLHYFAHQADDFTLTSKNQIWTFPTKEVTTNSIVMCGNMTQTRKYYRSDCYAICTDYCHGL